MLPFKRHLLIAAALVITLTAATMIIIIKAGKLF